MKVLMRSAVCMLSLVVTVGCASTETSNRQILVDEMVPRPDHIWVYDFAATAAEVPADSVLAGQHTDHPTPQTPEQIEAGRQVGDSHCGATGRGDSRHGTGGQTGFE